MTKSLRCPNCSSRALGRVGVEQYYCWECCIEFSLAKQTVTLYEVQVDGSLASMSPMAES
ncbi:MAG: hypothetical protein KGZ92_08230 [Firmicutes bacterium]|nr:hypothetical protein [Dethiobacter sp.]MBS3889254.1 hypothetical protein [Bacillota bacterium]MBS4054468.1 hypothetical protein [Thermaerobacter sp.]